MKSLTGTIRKLVFAFQYKYNRIIIINSIQFYSKNLKKRLTCYEVNEVTEEKLISVEKLKEMKKEYKKIKNKKEKLEFEEKIFNFEKELHEKYIFKTQIYKKIGVLEFLVYWYNRMPTLTLLEINDK